MKTATGPEALAYGVYLHACHRSELMIFTVLLGLAAAVDMHQKVTPVQKVPATEHGLIEPKKKRVSESGKFAAVADVRRSSIAQAFNQDNG